MHAIQRLRTAFLFGVFGLAVVVAVGAEEELGAVAQEVSGEVEVSIEGQEWIPLEEGDAVPIDTRISTSFGADAVIAVGENAELTVEPLTRIEIEDLVAEEGVDRSEMNLEVGRIQGDVEDVEDRETEFEVRSEVATASVRGTSFVFDGESLSVQGGEVAIANAYGRERTVSVAEESSASRGSSPESPSENRNRRATTQTSTRDDADAEDDREAPAEEDVLISDEATLIIDWELD